MYVVLIETSGNQNYIFATNKLRENVGASELTYQVGTKLVMKAAGRSGYKYEDDISGDVLRGLLLNETPIDPNNKSAVEVVIATSGKAILLVADESKARNLITEVTKDAAIKMPGLTVHGAIFKVNPDLTNVHRGISEVHHRLETIRYQIPSTQQRFLRLPFAAPCDTSGLPATEVKNLGTDTYAFSKVTLTKRTALGDAGKKHVKGAGLNKGRILDLLEQTFRLSLPKHLEEFGDAFTDSKWLAVIHADGNGLGEVFLKFHQHLGLGTTGDFNNTKEARDYLDAYRKFSIALDLCTVNAAVFALKNLENEFTKKGGNDNEVVVPVIPLVLGGDDLTVLCDGQYALKFAKDFLTQFEEETRSISQKFTIQGVEVNLRHPPAILNKVDEVVPKIANRAFGNRDDDHRFVERLGMCAGIAIIKPHYPFHQAYELAQQLLRSAKQVKQRIQHARRNADGKDEWVQVPSSAFDFHIIYDSAYSDLTPIRDEKLKVGRTYLSAKPYVVTKDLAGQENNSWLQHRRFEQLRKRIVAMSAPGRDDATRRALPNGKLHEIRQSLFRGIDAAKAETSLIQKRLDPDSKKQFEDLLTTERSIFFKEHDKTFTHFLDAIELVDFWKGFEVNGSKPAGDNPTTETSATGEVQND